MGSSPLQNSCSCFSSNEETKISLENNIQLPSKKFSLTRVDQVHPDDEESLLKIMELYETIVYNTMSTGNVKTTFRKNRSLSVDTKKGKFMEDLDPESSKRNRKRKGTKSWSVADYRHRKDDNLRKKELFGILKNRVNTSRNSPSQKKCNRVTFHPSVTLFQNY